MRRFMSIFSIPALLVMLFARDVYGEPVDGSGKGDWSPWKKSPRTEVGYRFICDGYDKQIGCYAMRFAFKNGAPVPVIVTYIGTNPDGERYAEDQYLEPGEEAEKMCHGDRGNRSTCTIAKVRPRKPHG